MEITTEHLQQIAAYLGKPSSFTTPLVANEMAGVIAFANTLVEPWGLSRKGENNFMEAFGLAFLTALMYCHQYGIPEWIHRLDSLLEYEREPE